MLIYDFDRTELSVKECDYLIAIVDGAIDAIRDGATKITTDDKEYGEIVMLMEKLAVKRIELSAFCN